MLRLIQTIKTRCSLLPKDKRMQLNNLLMEVIEEDELETLGTDFKKRKSFLSQLKSPLTNLGDQQKDFSDAVIGIYNKRSRDQGLKQLQMQS